MQIHTTCILEDLAGRRASWQIKIVSSYLEHAAAEVSVEECDTLANVLGHVEAREVAVEGTKVNLKHSIGVGLNTQAYRMNRQQATATASQVSKLPGK